MYLKKGAYIFLILFVWLNIESTAQVGVFGKRFILKTPVVNGLRKPFPGLEVEYALARKFSISASYDFLTQNHKLNLTNKTIDYWLSDAGYSELAKFYPQDLAQDLAAHYYNTTSYNNSSPETNRPEPKDPIVKVEQSIYGFNLNFYSSSLISAPKGGYFTTGFRTGSVSVDGAFRPPDVYWEDNYYDEDYIYNGFKPSMKFGERSFRYKSFIAGFGVQEVFFEHLTLDFSIAGVLSFLRAKNSGDLFFARGISGGLSPNLVSASGSGLEDKYVAAMGLSATIKAGWLIF